MKGTLKKINNEWIVDYIHPNRRHCLKVPSGQEWRNDIHIQLPLHPDDERDLVSHWYENMEVKFEFSTYYDEKLGEGQPRGIGYVKVAKLVQEEPQENWDAIFQDFEDVNRTQFLQRMKDLYHPPKRIKS